MTEPRDADPTQPQPEPVPQPEPEPQRESPRPLAGNSEPPPPPAVATPLVAWEPPAPPFSPTASSVGGYPGGRPPFGIGALFSDTFARYGADALRFIAVAAVTSVISWAGSFASASSSSSPFEPSRSEGGALLSLLGFVAGIIASSTLYALADSDRSVPFQRVLKRGLDRSGWVFLATLLLIVAFVVLLVLGIIVTVLLGIIARPLALAPALALIIGFVWLGSRLSLAMPAVVADGYDAMAALKLSWRITSPTGVWLRIFGAGLLMGLLFAPAGLGAAMLVFAAMFDGGGSLLLLLVPAIAFTVLTPITTLLSFSAYRRLVVPHHPRWTAAPAPPAPMASVPPPPMPSDPAGGTAVDAATAADATVAFDATAAVADAAAGTQAASTTFAAPATPPAPPPAPPFTVPRLGTAGKALLALVLAFDVAGIVAIPYGLARMEALFRNGFPGLPGFPGGELPGQSGNVAPGNIEFGVGADLETCTLDTQSYFAERGAHVEWLARLPHTLEADDEVFLRVRLNQDEPETTFQQHGAEACLTGETPDAGLRSGMYVYELLVNGDVEASGTLLVS